MNPCYFLRFVLVSSANIFAVNCASYDDAKVEADINEEISKISVTFDKSDLIRASPIMFSNTVGRSSILIDSVASAGSAPISLKEAHEDLDLIFERGDFKITKSMLSTPLSFNHKYLTFEVPSEPALIEKLFIRVEKLAKYVYNLVSDLSQGIKIDVGKFEEFLIQISSTYHATALQRFLTSQLLLSFEKLYEAKKSPNARPWVKRGDDIVRMIELVHNHFPRNYLLEYSYAPEDHSAFLREIDEYIAFSWAIDYFTLYDLFKRLGYAYESNSGPFAHLLATGDTESAYKMILHKQLKLNPGPYPQMWFALINSPATRSKLKLMQRLIADQLLDLNWKVSGKDFIMHSLDSPVDQDLIIAFLFQLEAKVKSIKLPYTHEFYDGYATQLGNKQHLIARLLRLKKS